jgi:hypothetical protein
MFNVVTSFGNYPTNTKPGEPGPYTAEELGLIWLEHVAKISRPEMLKNYRLVLVLPRDIQLPARLKPFLDLWGATQRVDENNGVQQWPLGPNLVFRQVLWLYHYKKLEGPFLWCEPDCVPVTADWLDSLFGEYQAEGKLFMGAFVDVFSDENKTRIPRHMTGNGIYPGDAYKPAPALMEARMTPWDVWAAQQIMRSCHFTKQIQHEYRHSEITSVKDLRDTLKPGTVLFHSDKFGAIARLLGGVAFSTPAGPREETFPEPGVGSVHEIGQSQAPVFLSDGEDLDRILDRLKEICSRSEEQRRKVAYFMLENKIIVGAHFSHHVRRQAEKKKQEALASATAGSTG